MPSGSDELKAQLMKEAEGAITRMLAERGKKDRLPITDIE
jgi:hypothetical protein